MESTLDEVRQELADIHDQLLSLAADDFGKRVELRNRQNELRALSHQLVEGQPLHDAESLKAAYTRLQTVRDHLIEARLGASSSGGAAAFGGFTVALNQAIDAAVGTDEIEARLMEILEQLRKSD